MANPIPLSDQIADSVTQANVKVLGDAPAIAMGHLYQSFSPAVTQALADVAHNVTTAQQQAAIAQASAHVGITTLHSTDTNPEEGRINQISGC